MVGITERLKGNPDEIILQDHENKILLSDVKNRVSSVQSVLVQADADRCALMTNDALLFISTLLACSLQGVTVLLPANDTADMLQAVAADVYIGDFERPTPVEDISAGGSVDMAVVENDIEIVVFTSGSTGKAKQISRKLSQFIAETKEIDRLWGKGLGSAVFMGTVSHQHIYGLLFKILWPFLNKSVIFRYTIPFVEVLFQLRDKFEQTVLISSPAFLKRLNTDETDTVGRKAKPLQVFSSGGLLTEEATKNAESQLNGKIIQVYGSSETGGIAHKILNAKWQFFPSVEHKLEADVLFVRSPFCYTDAWQCTNDLVRLDTDGFALNGRNDRIVKVEEKRVSLVQIEQSIGQLGLSRDVYVLSFDHTRQYIAAVIELNEKGWGLLHETGQNAFKKNIRLGLLNQVEKIAMPRKIRFVEKIPENAQGKKVLAKIKALFT